MHPQPPTSKVEITSFLVTESRLDVSVGVGEPFKNVPSTKFYKNEDGWHHGATNSSLDETTVEEVERLILVHPVLKSIAHSYGIYIPESLYN